MDGHLRLATDSFWSVAVTCEGPLLAASCLLNRSYRLVRRFAGLIRRPHCPFSLNLHQMTESYLAREVDQHA